MTLAPFFERIYSALGGHLSVSRDDLALALQDVVIGLTCGEALSENEEWIAELSANLIARLYPRVAVTGPERFTSALRALIIKINPGIEIVAGAEPSRTIAIGRGSKGASLFPSASGWVARLDHASSRPSGPTNPYASCAAAAFAMAELFRRVLLRSDPESDFSLSLLTFDESTGQGDQLVTTTLGDVLFVAAGAVGNAGLWCLARDKKRKGSLTVVDDEELELSNLQRYVLGGIEDVGKQKVRLVEEAFAGSTVSVRTLKSTLESFAEQSGGVDSPTICISVDNVAARRAAQALLPRLIINGWTGEQSLGVSCHVFSQDRACLACLYQPHGPGSSQTEQAANALGLSPERAALLWVTRVPLSDDDIATAADKLGVSRELLAPWRGRSLGDLYTDVVCGAAPISLPVTDRVEIVPLAHQSALAGILMATELVKRTSPQLASKSESEPLVSWDDVLLPPPKIWAKPRAREQGCICGDPDYQGVYARKWLSRKGRARKQAP